MLSDTMSHARPDRNDVDRQRSGYSLTPQAARLAAWLLSPETGSAAPAAGVAASPGGPGADNGRERAHAARPIRKARAARAGCPRSWQSSSAGVSRLTPSRLAVVPAVALDRRFCFEWNRRCHEAAPHRPERHDVEDGVDFRIHWEERGSGDRASRPSAFGTRLSVVAVREADVDRMPADQSVSDLRMHMACFHGCPDTVTGERSDGVPGRARCSRGHADCGG